MSRCKNEATETAWLSVCCASAICLKRSQTTQTITEPSVAVETEGIHTPTAPPLHVKGQSRMCCTPAITRMHVSIGICPRSLEIWA